MLQHVFFTSLVIFSTQPAEPSRLAEALLMMCLSEFTVPSAQVNLKQPKDIDPGGEDLEAKLGALNVSQTIRPGLPTRNTVHLKITSLISKLIFLQN